MNRKNRRKREGETDKFSPVAAPDLCCCLVRNEKGEYHSGCLRVDAACRYLASENRLER